MSNFVETNILELLGVCLDNDPHFIILELMNSGDLLSYLRAARPTLVSFYYQSSILVIIKLLLHIYTLRVALSFLI